MRRLEQGAAGLEAEAGWKEIPEFRKHWTGRQRGPGMWGEHPVITPPHLSLSLPHCSVPRIRHPREMQKASPERRYKCQERQDWPISPVTRIPVLGGLRGRETGSPDPSSRGRRVEGRDPA